MNGMYVVEDRLTKMCLEMVNSLTSANKDIEGLAKEHNLALLLGFQNLARSVEAMMSLIQDELYKDAEALLLDTE